MASGEGGLLCKHDGWRRRSTRLWEFEARRTACVFLVVLLRSHLLSVDFDMVSRVMAQSSRYVDYTLLRNIFASHCICHVWTTSQQSVQTYGVDASPFCCINVNAMDIDTEHGNNRLWGGRHRMADFESGCGKKNGCKLFRPSH